METTKGVNLLYWYWKVKRYLLFFYFYFVSIIFQVELYVGFHIYVCNSDI